MGEGKRDLFAEQDAQTDIAPLLPSTTLQSSIGPDTSSLPNIEEMMLRKAVDPYNSNPLVFPYFPSAMLDVEKAIWKDPETPDTFGRFLDYSRNAPRKVSFELFVNDYGMSNKTAQKSIKIRRAEMIMSWLKIHMLPPFDRISQEDTEATPPLMELVPFPTIDAQGQQSSIFRCIIEQIQIRSTIVRGNVRGNSRFEGLGRVQPRLGDRLRATISVTLRSHEQLQGI